MLKSMTSRPHPREQAMGPTFKFEIKTSNFFEDLFSPVKIRLS